MQVNILLKEYSARVSNTSESTFFSGIIHKTLKIYIEKRGADVGLASW
jgi:hypothetical protein